MACEVQRVARQACALTDGGLIVKEMFRITDDDDDHA